MKSLRLNLTYLATTYGIDELISCWIEPPDENGKVILVIEGERRKRG